MPGARAARKPDERPISASQHVFKRGTDPAAGTLLVLHGTGGNENDMLPLGRAIAPGAALLSPRGKVLENGKPRFFRRLAEGVFDVEDLKRRAGGTRRLRRSPPPTTTASTPAASDRGRLLERRQHRVGPRSCSVPDVLAAAVLFRAMVPLEPDPLPAPADAACSISNGRADPLVAPEETERLAPLLQRPARRRIAVAARRPPAIAADFNAARAAGSRAHRSRDL